MIDNAANLLANFVIWGSGILIGLSLCIWIIIFIVSLSRFGWVNTIKSIKSRLPNN